MNKFWLVVYLGLISTTAIAEPDQIDVMGLVPGVSSKDAFRAAGKPIGDSLVYLEIGGYKLPCLGQYIDGIIENFGCSTGGTITEASNIEIHETLVKGFTSKFGSPDKVYTSSVKTLAGVEHQKNEVWWIDKKGNVLVLYSMGNKIDEGAVLVSSRSAIKKEMEATAKKDKERKF